MTMPTLKWLLPRVGAHVNSKCTFVCKAPIALLALKSFLPHAEPRVEPRVEAKVLCQTAFLCKVFMTLTALIWLLTRMGTQVNFKCTIACKALIALLAFKRFLTRVEAPVC